MKIKNWVMIATVISSLVLTARLSAQAQYGELFLVSPGGMHIAPFNTPAKAATNIQSALDLAQDGDMIMVDSGQYMLTETLNINKGIILLGRYGADTTEINGGGNIRCAEIRHPDAMLDGFTITGGSAARGGGIWITNGIMKNCVITGNYAQLFGGGVDVQLDGLVSACVIAGNRAPTDGGGCGGGICLSDGAVLRDSTIYGNEAFSGGGVYMFADTLLSGCSIVSNLAWDTVGWGVGSGGGIALNGTNISASDSTIAHNVSQELGGGVHMSGHTGQKITSCLIYDNETAWWGGGIYVNLAPDPNAFENCTIVSNRSTHAVHGKGGGICSGSGQAFSFRNCIIYFNSATAGIGYNYHVVDGGGVTSQNSCTTPNPAGAGNIIANPLFTDFYRLNSNSPCINAGINLDWMASAYDIDGKPRIIGGTVDMGACEYGDAAGYSDMVLRIINPTDNQIFGELPEINFDMRAEQEWNGDGITQTVVRINGTPIDQQAWNNERYCMIDFTLPEVAIGSYFLTLEARDAHGLTMATSVFFRVENLLPGKPESVTASAGDHVSRVELTWQTAANTAWYEIWRQIDGGNAKKIAEIDSPSTNYTDTSVTTGIRYRYSVRAVNYIGAGEFSPATQGWPLLGPGIRLNGERVLELEAGTFNVDVTILLGAGAYTGTECDWWLIVHRINNNQFYYMDANQDFQQIDELSAAQPARQEAIFDIANPFTIMQGFTSPPPAGTEYHFYFGLDTRMNGQFDDDVLYYDKAVLNFH